RTAHRVIFRLVVILDVVGVPSDFRRKVFHSQRLIVVARVAVEPGPVIFRERIRWFWFFGRGLGGCGRGARGSRARFERIWRSGRTYRRRRWRGRGWLRGCITSLQRRFKLLDALFHGRKLVRDRGRHFRFGGARRLVGRSVVGRSRGTCRRGICGPGG